MKHSKGADMLQGACVPIASNSRCQKEIAKKMNEDEKNLEIKI